MQSSSESLYGQFRIVDRVMRLENDNRRFKLVGLLVIVTIGVAAFAGNKTPGNPAETVTATKFVLVDADKNARAVLEMDSYNNPQLVFNHPDGLRTMSFMVLR